VGGPSARRATRGLDEVKPLGQKLAEAGHRVLVYDRRNCGASGISFDGGNSENEVWAEDLHELLLQLDAAPAFIGGSSSGCRLALLAALRHPADVRGLLLWRVTGGAFAAQRLAQNYYTQFIEAAERGGMEAVCRTSGCAARNNGRRGIMWRLANVTPALKRNRPERPAPAPRAASSASSASPMALVARS
jgi:pimeloyl-ACP methyl ester carboxylesterase